MHQKTTNMKHKSMLIISFLMIVLTSCRSTKDITMFQDLETETARHEVATQPEKHIIKPNDNLYVNILTLDPEVNKLYNPSLSSEGFASGTEQMYGSATSQYINGYRVNNKGSIKLPILGDVKVAGLTLDEAGELLKKSAEEYLKEPTVQIKLLNFTLNVLGEVNNPGFFYNYEGSVNIVEAISLANGITPYADLKNVIVNRQNPNGVYTHKLDLTKSNIYNSDVFYLQPNDLVYIPPNKLKRKQENNTTYSLILSTISTLLVIFTLTD